LFGGQFQGLDEQRLVDVVLVGLDDGVNSSVEAACQLAFISV